MLDVDEKHTVKKYKFTLHKSKQRKKCWSQVMVQKYRIGVGPQVEQLASAKSTDTSLEELEGDINAGELWPWLVWLSGLGVGCKPEGHQYYSQSGHMPGLQARSPVGMHERQPCINISLPLFLLPSPSL